MDTQQINHALRMVPSFRGTFAINQIPLTSTMNPPWALVFNTDPFPLEGQHWIALFSPPKGVGSGRIEYFDSLGQPPIHHENLSKIFASYADVVHSTQRIQSDCSSVCGEYCVLYLYARMMGDSPKEFFDCFSSTELVRNDRVVHSVVSEHFDILPKQRHFPVIFPNCMQTSRALV